jgi:hypothetical protein
MSRPSLRFATVFFIILGCGGATAEQNAEQSTGSAGSSATVSEEPARHPALAPLRPGGSDAVLAALAATLSSEAHADAASFYADTDAPGMTIFWGLTAGAAAFDHPRRAELAGAMKRVLQERVVVADGGARISVRFAPGATPAFEQPDGTLLAPVAHLFETVFTAALAPVAAAGWSPESMVGMVDAYAQIAARGTPIDPVAPIQRWLVELRAAGHLNGFALHVFDVAAAEDAAAVEAARQWAGAHPLILERATMPDELVPMTP